MRTEAKTTGPSSRRSCLVGSGLTAAVARSAEGASDRIRMGVIGTGTRGSYMATVLESARIARSWRWPTSSKAIWVRQPPSWLSSR